MESQFKGLSLFPLYLGWGAKQTGGLNQSDRDAINTLVKEHPEKIPSMMWWGISDMVKEGGGDSFDRSNAIAWFNPAVPTGTAFSLMPRLNFLRHGKARNLEYLKPYLDIAPTLLGLKYTYVKAKYGEQPSLEVMRAEFGDALDFDIELMKLAVKGQENDPVAYPEQLTKIAEFVPAEFETLANYYLQQGNQEKAAEAYQKFFDKCPDRVLIANSMEWLVNYYEDKGEKDKAMLVAKEGAEVYSSQGLATMGKLLEKRGELSEAESYYLKIQERYNDGGPLLGFYQRKVAEHPEYRVPMNELGKNFFPDGMTKVTLADFKGEPTGGVSLDQESALMDQVGLKAGAIIVAIDGTKVESEPQYTTLRAANPSPAMKLIVYQDGAYKEVEASPPGKLFGVKISTYPKR